MISLFDDPRVLLALIFLGGVMLGVLLTLLAGRAERQQLRERTIRLEVELETARQSVGERKAAFEQAHLQLRDSFSALAGEALRRNSGQFLRLARENLQRFQVQAQGELGQREKAVENLVGPIRAMLEKTEAQLRTMEMERREAYGSLTRHLESVTEAQQALHGETRRLVQALRRPEVRGQWGELTLRRLVELAGMVEHCDFEQQAQVQGEDGPLRPDMVIHMPDQRDIVVDAKTPLDAYLSALESEDDNQRRQQLERHARKVRERVRELSGKHYWQQFPHSPDFVVLFIPGDQFLSAALEHDPQLLEQAMAQKVIIATPTSLVALLRAVGYGWRQLALAENAEKIRQVGEELYARLTTFSEHLERLGRSLDGSVGHFNKLVGAFDGRVLPGARKFTEMGITAKRPLEPVQQVEKAPRSTARPLEPVQQVEKAPRSTAPKGDD